MKVDCFTIVNIMSVFEFKILVQALVNSEKNAQIMIEKTLYKFGYSIWNNILITYRPIDRIR